ncbi:uncharacterized protein EV422DRAFT_519958 [Fimicolochytrium jonesii]|uniref:uncharacterized protein n=1 Tax=Fimicolochytrium jonesii TaxID=1396493 RepID=UPI0022FE6EA5|nr:uncharacterized protein EV422DRAFT_519958 [Fimicolochytrium jonesii]KAI8824397.1 hypothetical protein EV422DRAFT_519958 [Fimicolochytrium jonesii]
MPQLQELDYYDNRLVKIRLKTLDVSANRIEHLQGLEALENLQELCGPSALVRSDVLPVDTQTPPYLGKHCHPLEVEFQLEGKKRLRTVYFEGNPPQTAAGATYRSEIEALLRN